MTEVRHHRPSARGRAPSVRSRITRGVTALALVLGLAGLANTLAPAPALAATGPDVSTAIDPANGFPLWYQDAGGTRLAPCLDAADPNCVVLADATFDPTKPLAFPGNFPSEFFYTIVDSARLDTKGCSGTKPGRISIRMALEGAFANTTPVNGDQMAFGRVRLIATGGLCVNATYTVTYPYGQLTFKTDSSGALARNQGTTDIGCVPVAPTACDWRVALSSPVLKSFLRWDPAVAPAAPAGYLGDAATAHRITGATYTAPGETAPANYFKVTGPSLSNPLQTNLFTVSGKLAGPLTASPSSVDFGGDPVGETTTAKTITITNLAAEAITPQAASLTGTNAADFKVANDTCAGTSLARDASCTVDVTFSPSATGARKASLVVAHSGVRSPFSVSLTGTGTTPTDVAQAQVTPASIDFGDQRIGVRSAVREVKVSSTGTKPLEVSDVALAGADPGEFAITQDTCTGAPVAAGSSCSVSVAFDPTKVASASAGLRVTSNDTASPVTVTLAGKGYGGVAATSPGVSAFDGFPDWYQDERGVRLEQCIDPLDPNCIVLPGGTFTGQTPLSFADNFPDEFFYSVVDSDILSTPGCEGSAPGKAMIRMAVEGAFGQGEPLAGDQMTFGRIRINATSGLCPGQTYTFVHPYGVDQYTADADGGIKRAAGTEDIGCLGATPDTPCNFKDAVKSRVFGGFLRWDPATGAKAPPGYLGDGVSLHKIVGATYTAPGESAPANSFRIYQGDQLVAQTDLFTVMGKLGGPLVADAATVDYGGQEVGTTASKPVTLTNEGVDSLTVNGLSVTGAAAADFAVDGSNDACTGRSLAPGVSCTVNVGFTPGAVGDRTARLLVDHTGLNSPMPVTLTGVGLAGPGRAALSTDLTRLDFADLHVGRTSPTQTVTVSNRGGDAPLAIDGVSLTGADAVDFAVVGNTCTQEVAPGETCAVEIGFSPTAAGKVSATLRVTSATASPASVDVALSGTGFAGSSAVSSSVRDADGFPTWYQDGNGVRVVPCLDVADPRCVVLAGDGFDPAKPMSFPANFPPEFFYSLADSEVVSTPGCEGSEPGTAMLRLALEASFANGVAEPGQQTTFGRVRFNVTSGLCPGATYTFTTPYGNFDATADAAGGVARTVGTIDLGCGGAPCNFGSALSSPVLDGLVRWAPGVGDPAPAGYLGDGVSYHPIVGGTYTVAGKPVNYFEISAPDGSSVARTNRFLVSGKLASGLEAAPVGFADQQITTTSATKTVTFTNVGSAAVSVADAVLAGPDPGAFAITGGTCAGASVASDRTCTVVVSFTPSEVRSYSAEVRLRDAGGAVLGSGSVHGQGIDAGVPRASLSVTSLSFPNQEVGTTSTALNVQVTNTGTAPLVVADLALSGSQPADFTGGQGWCLLPRWLRAAAVSWRSGSHRPGRVCGRPPWVSAATIRPPRGR